MSIKSIVVKVIVGCVLIGLLLSAIYFLSRPEEKVEKSEIQVLKLEADKAQKIEVLSTDGFTLNLIDGKWKMEGMEEIGVNQAYASALAMSVSDIFASVPVGESADLSPYGLENPYIEVVTTYQDGKESVKIGKQTGNLRYVSISDSNVVYAVENEELYMTLMDKADYLDKRAVSLEGERITFFSVGDMHLRTKGDDWYQEKPYNRLADGNIVKNLISTISEITATDILPYEAVKAHFEENECKEVMIESENESASFSLCTKDETFTYLLPEGGNFVYKVLNENIRFVKITPFDVIVKNIAPIAISEVETIKFTSPEKTTVLSIEAPGSEAPLFYKDTKQVTEESFRAFYQKLMSLLISGEGEASGAAKYAIEISLENGEKMDVRFIAKDENLFAVSINGKTQFTISQKAVKDVFECLRNIEEV